MSNPRVQHFDSFSGVAVCALAGVLLGIGLNGCGHTSSTLPSVGTISTVAGNGTYGFSGNGGLATAAQLNQPTCAVADSAGNLYIGDIVTYTVRKVAAKTGIISPYAGNGIPAYRGDGGLATSASLYGPTACALDAAGNLYIADEANNVIRKVTASTGIIQTVVGSGFQAGTANGGFSGDGGQAIKAEINHPWGVALDAVGDLFIADTGNQRVRRVDASTGIISTVAGNGTYGYSGHGGKATAAMIANPEQIALDASGNLYIAEQGNSVISKLEASSSNLVTVAGNGVTGDGTHVLGDGELATQAQLSEPNAVLLDSAGNVYISDSGNQRVRMVSASTGIITTVIGSTVGYSGDGGPASRAQLHNPEGLFFDAAGNLYVADAYNSVIRKVTMQ